MPHTHLTHTPHAQTARRANLPQAPLLASSGKSKPCSRASRLDEEGRFGRSSRTVRRGCGGRGGHVGRTWPKRTAKSCGSGAPMQALNSQGAQRAPWGRRWQPSMVIGKSTKETVKTIAQGMPVDPAEPVVTAACFFCCRRAMGEAITRHSLRPLRFPRAKLRAALGRETRRGIAQMCSPQGGMI